MNLLDPISTIMTPNPISLSPSSSIKEAGIIFNKYNLHHIPVTLGKNLVGLISKSDYLFFRRGFLNDTDDQRIEDIRLNNYEVSYIMTKGIALLSPDDKINVAIEVFKENLFHAIPIVENEELVGIVTTYDIISQIGKDKEVYAKYA